MKVENEKLTSLYILVFPDRSMLKVGKANNVRIRGHLLQPTWGKIDYSESFELLAPTSVVFKLEKSLHFLLSGYKSNVNIGDGFTEMFELSALDSVVKHIDIFTSTSNFKALLKKGIEAPTKRIYSEDENAIDLSGASARDVIFHIGTPAWAVYSVIKDSICNESPSIPQIASIIGISKDTVARALSVLRRYKMLKIEKTGRANVYSMNSPCG